MACDAQTLVASAPCQICALDSGLQDGIIISQLCLQAGFACDPQSLATAASPYLGGIDSGAHPAVIVSLLCQWSGQADCTVQTLTTNAGWGLLSQRNQILGAVAIQQLCTLNGVSCDNNSLVSGAVEAIANFDGALKSAVMIYLLSVLAKASPSDSQTLMARASCLLCGLMDGTWRGIFAWLLCQIAGGTTPVPPARWVFTPANVTLLSENPFTVSSPSTVTSITFNGTTLVDFTVAQATPALTSFSAPNLTSITGGNLYFSNATALTSLSAPNLSTVSGNIVAAMMPGLTSVNLTGLTSVAALDMHGGGMTSLSFPLALSIGNTIDLSGCALVSFSAPNLILSSDPLSANVSFSNDNLNVTSVNQILARCRAGHIVANTIDLSGGTNAAPTGQGLLDKAALIAAYNTVFTN